MTTSSSETPKSTVMTTPTMTKRILYVGGSFGGMASFHEFRKFFTEARVPQSKQIEVYFIEPRAGFINLLGIPKAVLDVEFAKKTFMNLEKLNINFTSVESSDPVVVNKAMEAEVEHPLPSNLKAHFIHGKCVQFLDSHKVTYQLHGQNQPLKELVFDYCLFATGRRRRWPFDPVALTEEQYEGEMEKSKAKIEAAKNVTVIGGGALGIEIAGEVKETYPDKRVILVHPHPWVPPEIFSTKNFKETLATNITESGVEAMFNTRIEKELENGDLLTTDGRTIESDLNLWCNYHKNNIEPLLPVFKESIEEGREEVIVDERFIVKDTDNIFCVGDLTNLRIIKTCGAAWHQGRYVAESMFNILIKGEEKYHTIDLETWPHGMTIVVGTHRIVSQWDDIGDGKIVYNSKDMLEYYSDYGCKNIRADLEMAK